MPSRFIIDVISGSGTREGAGSGRGGTLILSSSVEIAPTSMGPSSTLYSNFIESFNIKGVPGLGLTISGSAPTEMGFGANAPAVTFMEGNLFLKGNVLNLSGSTYPYSGSRHSAYELTNVLNIANNVPNANAPQPGPPPDGSAPGVGALTIKGTGFGTNPTTLVSFVTTTGKPRTIFNEPIKGGGVMGVGYQLRVDSALDVQGNVTIDGDLTVDGNLTSIDTNHLVIKDPIIYLNSGSKVVGPSAIVFASGSTRTNGSDIAMAVNDPAHSTPFGIRGDNTVTFLSLGAQGGNLPANGIPTGDPTRWIGIQAATGSFFQITGSIRRTAQGQDFLQGSGNTNVSYNHANGAWTINSTGGGGGGGIGTGGNVFRDHGNSGGTSPVSRHGGGPPFSHATTSGSILFNPGKFGDGRQLGDRGMLNDGVGINVFFYVSGTMSRPPTPGAAGPFSLPSGPTAISGSVLLPDLHLSGALLGTGFSNDGMTPGGLRNILQMRAQFVGITDIQGSDFRSGKDNYFFVTGSSAGAKHLLANDPGQGNPGAGGAFAISTVFAGDVITSGSLHLKEAPSSRVNGGVELSFATADPDDDKPMPGYRIFVSGSSKTLSLNTGGMAMITGISSNKTMGGKVTVTGGSDETPPNRFIGEMMFTAQGNTGTTTFGIGTTVRIAETGGKLAQGSGLMLVTAQGHPGMPNDMFAVMLQNNTGVPIVLTGFVTTIEHFDT